MVLRLLRFLTQRAPEPGLQPAEILKAGGDVLKVSTGLATGALVFSVGLLKDAQTYGLLVRIALAASWTLLALSVVGGLLSQAAIPPLLEEKRYSLEEKTFTWPGRAHQVLLFLGVALLAAAMASTLFQRQEKLVAGSAVAAAAAARSKLGQGEQVRRLAVLELIDGRQVPGVAATWRVEFELAGPPGPPTYADVLVDSKSGRATRIR